MAVRRRLAESCCAAALALLGCGGAPADEPAAEPRRPAGSAAAADVGREQGGLALGPGYAVWESNRSGAWRIWRRGLDGSPPRQLSPDRPGTSHCCPHISPDGETIAYLEGAAGASEYPEDGFAGQLRLVRTDGGGDRELAPAARSYFENRAVVWRHAGELIHIDGERATVALDLTTGRSRRLAGPPPEHAWLIDASLGWATTGVPSFSPYESARQAVAARRRLGGCQPYFSRDGRWGFWTAGAGGPIDRIGLRDRTVARILDKNDPRVPDGYGYAYFPMLSGDGRLFAWAASRGDHDHFRADYEVFVAESDPDTLELIGPPLRITRHAATDRFPDVWQPPLALGRRAGEAPLTAAWQAPAPGDWQWSFGDGSGDSGRAVEHTWIEPGRYEVGAVLAERRLRGLVVVRPPRPPRPLAAAARAGGLEVEVTFDEEIDPAAARLEFESGRAIRGWQASADGRGLLLRLAAPLQAGDRLAITGVRDRAQRPNTMAAATLEVRPPAWPSRRSGLVFVWQTGDAANLVPVPGQEAERSYDLAASGEARLDSSFTMVLDGGAFVLGPQDAAAIVEALKRTNQLTLEATLHPDGGDGPVLASAAGRNWNFRLRQSAATLFFGLAVGRREHGEAELFRLPAGRPSHVAVAWEPGRLVAYLDGERRLDSAELQGDSYHWRGLPLVFGGGFWRGRVEGVALYDRVLPAAEVAENHRLYRALLEARKPVPRSVVVARRTAASRPPTLEEISPYREALATYEYRIERHLHGPPLAGVVRAAEWTMRDGSLLAAPAVAAGDRLQLTLEPFAAQPQLESVYLADTLEARPGAELFYVVETAPPD